MSELCITALIEPFKIVRIHGLEAVTYAPKDGYISGRKDNCRYIFRLWRFEGIKIRKGGEIIGYWSPETGYTTYLPIAKSNDIYY